MFKVFGKEFKLHTPYSLKLEGGAIAPYAQNQIVNILSAFNTNADNIQLDGYARTKDFIPESFEWQWSSRGGKLTTRLRKIYQRHYKISIPDEIISEIGNVAATYRTDKDTTVTLRFTDYLDWERGDFGDPNSCFWTVNRLTHTEFKENPNLFAVKFYEGSKGFARSLLYVQPEHLFIFNSYGLMTPYVASLMRRLLELESYKLLPKNPFYFDGSNDSTLWVNNGGHASVICSPDAGEPKVNHKTVWLWDNDDNYFMCEFCEDRFDQDYRCITSDHTQVCGSCYDNYMRTCDHCHSRYYDHDNVLDLDYVQRLPQHRNADYLCEECYNEMASYSQCSNCERWEHPMRLEYEYNDKGDVGCFSCCQAYRRELRRSSGTDLGFFTS